MLIVPMYAAGGDKYGNRLAGIEDVKLDDDLNDEVENKFKQNESVENVDIILKGKLYNVLITLKDNTDVNSLVEDAQSIQECFSKDELNYYDIQIFISSKMNSEQSDNDTTIKTIVCYRNSSREDFSWTNNR